MTEDIKRKTFVVLLKMGPPEYVAGTNWSIDSIDESHPTDESLSIEDGEETAAYFPPGAWTGVKVDQKKVLPSSAPRTNEVG